MNSKIIETSEFKKLLKQHLVKLYSEQEVKSWIEPISITCISDEDHLIINVPSYLIFSRIRSSYLSSIKDFAKKHLDQKIKDVKLQLVSQIPSDKETGDIIIGSSSSSSNAVSNLSRKKANTFDDFITHISNISACKASQYITTNDIDGSLALSIEGPQGCGKTHLLRSIEWEASKNGLNVVYNSASQFINNFIKSAKNGDKYEFGERYKSLDILIMDDIDLLRDKSATQDALHMIVSHLLDNKKRFVCSSSSPIDQLAGMNKRLARLIKTSGSSEKISKPEKSLRLYILEHYCKIRYKNVPRELFHLISTSITSDVRGLIGALTRIDQFQKLHNQVCTKEKALALLNDLTTGSTSIETIERVVCNKLNIETSEFQNNKRARKFARARQIIMYLAYHSKKMSFADISRAFPESNFSVSTVGYAVSRVEKLSKQDRDFCLLLKDIKDGLE